MANVSDLGLTPGKWLVSDCGKIPSESNCKLVIAAPVDQKAHLIDAVVVHSETVHGETDTPEYRAGVEKFLEQVEI